MWRIAVLHHGSPSSPALARLRQGLQRCGIAEGIDCVIDAQGAEGVWARLPLLTEQLLRRDPDAIVAIGAIAALAAQRATRRVPILHAIVLDPADIGLTGRNVSGITTFDPDQATRHLRLLEGLLPGLRNVAFVTDAAAPIGPDGRNPLASRFSQAAAALGLETTCVTLSGRDADLEGKMNAVQRAQCQALVALEVPAVLARLGEIINLAEVRRIPTLSPYGGGGAGLLMQGAALHDAIDPLAAHVGSFLRGIRIDHLPVRTVRHERLVIHRGRAGRVGLSVPACLLDRATLCIDDDAGEGEAAGC